MVFSGYRALRKVIKVSYESYDQDESIDMHICYILIKLSGHKL